MLKNCVLGVFPLTLFFAIGGTWRHSDVICGRPIPWTLNCYIMGNIVTREGTASMVMITGDNCMGLEDIARQRKGARNSPPPPPVRRGLILMCSHRGSSMNGWCRWMPTSDGRNLINTTNLYNFEHQAICHPETFSDAAHSQASSKVWANFAEWARMSLKRYTVFWGDLSDLIQTLLVTLWHAL